MGRNINVLGVPGERRKEREKRDEGCCLLHLQLPRQRLGLNLLWGLSGAILSLVLPTVDRQQGSEPELGGPITSVRGDGGKSTTEAE